MMKPLIATALAILFAMSSGWAFTACDRNDEPTTTVPGNTPTVDDGIDDNNGNTPDDNDNDNDNPETPDAMTLNMTIGKTLRLPLLWPTMLRPRLLRPCCR